jgi:hypothetical protein
VKRVNEGVIRDLGFLLHLYDFEPSTSMKQISTFAKNDSDDHRFLHIETKKGPMTSGETPTYPLQHWTHCLAGTVSITSLLRFLDQIFSTSS